MKSITLYGIPNCNTVKKARDWLAEHKLAYQFHDFKKLGLEPVRLDTWIKHVGWETLVNRKGTTWRLLTDAERDQVSAIPQAKALMLAKPSVIKRPVIEYNGVLLVGFDLDVYAATFSKDVS